MSGLTFNLYFCYCRVVEVATCRVQRGPVTPHPSQHTRVRQTAAASLHRYVAGYVQLQFYVIVLSYSFGGLLELRPDPNGRLRLTGIITFRLHVWINSGIRHPSLENYLR